MPASYEMAVWLGKDVDQPRNLAKTVSEFASGAYQFLGERAAEGCRIDIARIRSRAGDQAGAVRWSVYLSTAGIVRHVTVLGR
jgi:hypothetical protein